METPTGRLPSLRRLSFMAEVFQGSLRYLCFIQLAQIFKLENGKKHPEIAKFLQLDEQEHLNFDFLNLLLVTTDSLKKTDTFIPKIKDLVEELTEIGSDLFGTVLFLEAQRKKLIIGEIQENSSLIDLLNEYLTGLVFLVKKNIISIKIQTGFY